MFNFAVNIVMLPTIQNGLHYTIKQAYFPKQLAQSGSTLLTYCFVPCQFFSDIALLFL